jgi:hypothetical protein
MKENEMGGACSKYRRDYTHTHTHTRARARKIIAPKPEGKIPLRTKSRRWEDIKETGRESVE